MRTGLLVTLEAVILLLLVLDVVGLAVLLTAPVPPALCALGALALLGVAAAFVCVLALARLVEQGRIFANPAATRWVDAIVVDVAATGGVLVVAESALPVADPALVLVLMIATAALAAGLAVLVVVMRGLLRQAAALTAELAEVV